MLRNSKIVSFNTFCVTLPHLTDPKERWNISYRFIIDLLVKDGLGLSTITRLFPVVTTLSLSSQTIFPLLILSHLVAASILEECNLLFGSIELLQVKKDVVGLEDLNGPYLITPTLDHAAKIK